MTITLQDLQVLNEDALRGDWRSESYAHDDDAQDIRWRIIDSTGRCVIDSLLQEHAESIAALVSYYRSGALQRLAELAEDSSHLIVESGKFFDWGNAAGVALNNLLDAYERRIRSECTPEQLEKKPWECMEYIEARRVLEAKPNWFIAIDSARAPSVKEGK